MTEPVPARPAATLRQFAPIFPVRDLAASLAHYARLGFSTAAYTGTSAAGGHGFARRDDVEIHLGTVPTGRATAPSTAYLFVDDADALTAEWRLTGADVRPPQGLAMGPARGRDDRPQRQHHPVRLTTPRPARL